MRNIINPKVHQAHEMADFFISCRVPKAGHIKLLHCRSVPTILHDIKGSDLPEAQSKHNDTSSQTIVFGALALEPGGPESHEDERGRAGQVQEADYEALGHELAPRLRVEEHDLPGLRIRVISRRRSNNVED